jgi:hypothetical protein
MTECPKCHRMVDELSIPEPGGACSKCLSFCSSPPACSAAHADRKTVLTLCAVCKRDRRFPIDFVHTSYAVCKDCWDNWIAGKPQNVPVSRVEAAAQKGKA